MDDLISRKEAIDWIKGWFDTDKHYHPYSKGKTIPTCEVMDILERVPSAEPERKKEVVTPNEFETSMKKIAIEHDPETFHEYADDLMCAVLNGLGYEDGVKIFQDTEKWYS